MRNDALVRVVAGDATRGEVKQLAVDVPKDVLTELLFQANTLIFPLAIMLEQWSQAERSIWTQLHQLLNSDRAFIECKPLSNGLFRCSRTRQPHAVLDLY